MKQEQVPYLNERWDKDPSHKEKFDHLMDEDALEPFEPNEEDLRVMFVENTIKSSKRYISNDQSYISLKGISFMDLKSQAMFELGRGKLIINQASQDDRVRVSFYSGISEPTGTIVSIPIYLTVEFIL